MGKGKFNSEEDYKKLGEKLEKKDKKAFVKEYNKLAITLISEYDSFIKTNDFNYKVDYLEQKLCHIDKMNIIRRNYDIVVKENTRNSSILLDDTYNYLHKELAKTYKAPTKISNLNIDALKAKRGRRKITIKNAVDYLQNIQMLENKTKFLELLSKKYENTSKKVFVDLMSVLYNLNYIEEWVSNKEIKIAFEKALKIRETQSESNFNIKFIRSFELHNKSVSHKQIETFVNKIKEEYLII